LLHKFLVTKKKSFEQCTENDLGEYFSEYFLTDKFGFVKIAEATSIRRKISCFRSFFAFLVEQNAISQNPILEVEVPKKSVNLPFYLTTQEIDELFENL
jgi:site-specific recombinase XerD